MRTWRHPTNWIAVGFLLAASSSYASPGRCTNKWASYDGYTILKVDVKNPIGFITPWGSLSSSLKKGLKLKQNEPFSLQSFEADSAFLGSTLKGEFVSTAQTVKLSYAGGEITDCDPEARTLRVVYPIFTSVVPSFIPTNIEEQRMESERPGTTGATRVSERNMLIAPLAGYTQTRGTWGGLIFSDTISKARFHGEAEASGNSVIGHFDIGGNKGPFRNLWEHLDWAGTFEYVDTPAGSTRFKEGKVTARFSACTKELSNKRALIRYGGALEGGHQQSTEPLPVTQLPNSGYGSLKLYVGVTGRPGRSGFTASYGFQLGDTFLHGVPVFKKHLVDLGYNVSVPVPFRKSLGDSEDFKGPLSTTVHRSLNVETRFAAGLIQNRSGAPLAERFLGGDIERPFVQDNSWLILSNPFIRSIPENQLGALLGTESGGSRFYSGNATLSFTVWGRPMLPKELATSDSSFPGVLNTPFHTAAAAMANTYKQKDVAYIRRSAAISAKATELSEKLTALSDELKLIPPAAATEPAISRCLKAVKSNLLSTKTGANLVAASPDPQVVGQLVNNSLPTLSGLIRNLTDILRESIQTQLAGTIDATTGEIDVLGKDIRDADNLPSKKFEDEAWRKLAPGHRAIDVFLHQLNVYSVSPVAIFDVARVWPVNEGVRYGVGPGLRFSLVNANFTLTYGFNPQRSDLESMGTLFFKLDVSSLF